MKKLVLHIGNHKTGTSTLQLTLKQNEAGLKRQGFSFFQENPDGTISKEGNSSHWVSFENQNPLTASVVDGLALAASKLPGTVIVSTEELSWLFKKENIQSFHDELLKYFSTIEVICYLRRQDQHAISHYQQACKNPFWKTFNYFGNSIAALPEYQDHLQLYFDYYTRISTWSEIFGKNNIVLRVYDKEHLYKESVVDDFAKQLGLVFEERLKNTNISYSVDKTKINHLMNTVGVDPKNRFGINTRFKEGQKPLPSQDQAIKFYNYFKESNKNLNKQFRLTDDEFLFNDDFSFYPEKSNYEWTEDRANEAIKNILLEVKKTSERVDKLNLDKAGLQENIERLKNQKSQLSHELDEIKTSKSWAAIVKFRELKKKLLKK